VRLASRAPCVPRRSAAAAHANDDEIGPIVTSSAPDSAPVEMPMRRERLFDPPAELGRLRAQRPLCRLRYRSGEVGWLVTSYGLARAVMTDARFILGRPRPFPTQDPVKHAALVETPVQMGASGGDLLALDAPDHMRVRRLLVSDFSVRRMDELESHVARIVGARLDAMQRSGPPVDLVEAFASPIALSTHCALLGVPEEDGAHLGQVTHAVADPECGADEVRAALLAFRDYLDALVARKREEPGDDVISHLVAAGELTDGELLSLILLLFNAGVDTAATMLATGPFALLCHPDQLAALRADPTAIDAAVEELMRYLTVFQVGALTRTAREDVVLGDQTIRAGESVTVSLAAADRDPERFADPDTLDIHRSARGQLGFGHGPHVCLGQHLARLEMRVGIGELLRRLPTLRLAVAVEEVPVSGEQHLIFGVPAEGRRADPEASAEAAREVARIAPADGRPDDRHRVLAAQQQRGGGLRAQHRQVRHRRASDGAAKEAREVRGTDRDRGRELVHAPGATQVLRQQPQRERHPGTGAREPLGLGQLPRVDVAREAAQQQQQMRDPVRARLLRRRRGQLAERVVARLERRRWQVHTDDAGAGDRPQQQAQAPLLGEPQQLALEQAAPEAAVDDEQRVAVAVGVPGAGADREGVAGRDGLAAVERLVQAGAARDQGELDEVVIVRDVAPVHDVPVDVDVRVRPCSQAVPAQVAQRP
jgi:cytochrome P450